MYADAQSHWRWHICNCPCQFLILYICCQVKTLKFSRQGLTRIHFWHYLTWQHTIPHLRQIRVSFTETAVVGLLTNWLFKCLYDMKGTGFKRSCANSIENQNFPQKNEQVLKQESSNCASQSSLFCLWLCLLILVQWHSTVHHSHRAHTCTQTHTMSQRTAIKTSLRIYCHHWLFYYIGQPLYSAVPFKRIAEYICTSAYKDDLAVVLMSIMPAHACTLRC